MFTFPLVLSKEDWLAQPIGADLELDENEIRNQDIVEILRELGAI